MWATKETWHCLQNTSHVLVSFIYNIIYLQAVSDPRLYEACYVHTNWSRGIDLESQKKLFPLNTIYLPIAFYCTYESPDECVSSLLYSASQEKSSGIVQNKTKRVTIDSSDLSFLFCFYPDPLVSWEHSWNQRGGQICNIFLVNNLKSSPILDSKQQCKHRKQISMIKYTLQRYFCWDRIYFKGKLKQTNSWPGCR